MRSAILALGLVASLTLRIDAQRKPRSSGRGVPCGNSYISPDKVCHIATTSAPKVDSTKAATPATSAATASPVVPAGTALASGAASATGATATTAPMTVSVPPAYAEFLAPLREMIGFRVVLKNPPIDDKWLRNATLTEVHSDHLLLMAENRRIRIPLASIDMYYTDPDRAGELTIAFRK